jgi:hypothetical protein
VRRLTAAITTLLTVIGLLAFPLTASAHQTEKYKDKFTSISWWGSDGSLPWSDPWVEINDDGDEKKGNVRVVSSGNCHSGNCLWIGALTTLLGQIGARRPADTSGFEDLFLRFDLYATASLLASELEVQVKGGGGWTTVAEYQLGTELDVSPTIDISGYRSADFQVRFLFSGLLLSSEVFIDNVEIYGSTVETTTTSTTTAPTTTTTTVPTTTTAPTTTTVAPAVTSTTQPSITTTTTTNDGGEKPGSDKSTATTSAPSTSTAKGSAAAPHSSTSTTTSTTTTTLVALAGGGGSSGPGAPDGGGLRLAARGMQANFQGDLYGEVRGVAYLNGVDLQADYNMAVEIIESSWGWIVLLGVVVAYSILSGLDRRRRRSDI